jgi:hypothetical protein
VRVFVIDTRNTVPELQGGMTGVVGKVFPFAEEKTVRGEMVSRYVGDRC